MTASAHLITPNNGVEMPELGLGVFQGPPAETVGAVETAIAERLPARRHRRRYGNEREVGEGIRRSRIDRGVMFVTTKLWISDLRLRAGLRRLRRLPAPPRLRLRRPLPAPRSRPSNFDGTVTASKAAEEMLVDGTRSESRSSLPLFLLVWSLEWYMVAAPATPAGRVKERGPS